jgi:hypothetical protein
MHYEKGEFSTVKTAPIRHRSAALKDEVSVKLPNPPPILSLFARGIFLFSAKLSLFNSLKPTGTFVV